VFQVFPCLPCAGDHDGRESAGSRVQGKDPRTQEEAAGEGVPVYPVRSVRAALSDGSDTPRPCTLIHRDRPGSCGDVKRAPRAGDSDLRDRLAGARRVAVVGIGDEDSPVDRLGMVAARELARSAIPGIRVFFAGTVPESMTGPLRKFHPDHVLFLDAADMGNPPGTVAVIDPERISAGHVSTHALPLSAVMEFIAGDTGAKVTLVGIQPGLGEGEMAGDGAEILDRNIGELEEILRNACE